MQEIIRLVRLFITHLLPLLKGKVRQLLWRDPHQLYQRLEAIVKDCVLEQKVKLIKLLKSQAKNPSLAQDFIQRKSLQAHLCILNDFIPDMNRHKN